MSIQKIANTSKYPDCFHQIGLSVFLSAVTNGTAGFWMIFASTLCFYEIGVFMLVVTIGSYLYATLFFMSLLAVVGGDCNCVMRWRRRRRPGNE